MDVPAGVTQEECHTRFLIHLLSAVRALIFLARRIQLFLSLVDCEVEFCVLTIYSFSTRWAFLFCFLVRKIPFAGIELTSQRVRGLRGTSELPERPLNTKYPYCTTVARYSIRGSMRQTAAELYVKPVPLVLQQSIASMLCTTVAIDLSSIASLCMFLVRHSTPEVPRYNQYTV